MPTNAFSDAELLEMIADGLLGSGFYAHRQQILDFAARLRTPYVGPMGLTVREWLDRLGINTGNVDADCIEACVELEGRRNDAKCGILPKPAGGRYPVTIAEIRQAIGLTWPNAVAEQHEGIPGPHHILWMCDQVEHMDDARKAARWIGYMVAWMEFGAPYMARADWLNTRSRDLIRADVANGNQ